MITHLELQLKLPRNEKIHANLSYALYGSLCGSMPIELAEAFHAQEITPLRQNLRPAKEDGQCIWALDLFDAAEELLGLLCELRQIPLHCYDEPVQVLSSPVVRSIAISQLLSESQTWPGNAAAEIIFETPCSFKVAGEYAMFPTTDLLVQSLFFRWNALIPDCSLEDQDALHLLASGLKIRQYRLSSRNYWMKGQRIPGFSGSIQISSRLPAPMLELWHLLLTFAPYSGIGIKPALGMCAVSVRPVPVSRKNSLL